MGGKLPHRLMQRLLPAEVSAAADSLQELSLSEVPPIYLIPSSTTNKEERNFTHIVTERPEDHSLA